MRLRITFAKQGALRYTGHLDLHRIWERAARRADLPLAYSRGFHPQPKLNLASALPLGFSSRCEVLDMRLNLEIPVEGLAGRIQEAVPGGLRILNVEKIDEKLPALQTLVQEAEYEARLTEPMEVEKLRQRVEAMLRLPSIPRERRGKAYDLRPLIHDLRVEADADNLACLKMRLRARASATGRPEEVLDHLGIPPETARIERTGLIFGDSIVK